MQFSTSGTIVESTGKMSLNTEILRDSFSPTNLVPPKDFFLVEEP